MRQPTLQRAIYEALVRAGRPLSMREIGDAIGRVTNVVREAVDLLEKRGLVGITPAPEGCEAQHAVIVTGPMENDWTSYTATEIEKIRNNVGYGLSRWKEQRLADARRVRQGEKVLEELNRHLELRELAKEGA